MKQKAVSIQLIQYAIVLLVLVNVSRAWGKRSIKVPLLIRVATCKGNPVKKTSWVKAHLDSANDVFAPHGIKLVAQIELFRPSRCELDTREHRDAMAIHVTSKKATILVVSRVRDIDLTSYNLMGVHWRYRGDQASLRGRRWVFLTARAKTPVLAHELCHYFGLRHDPKGGNLMTPGPSAPVWRRAGKKPRKFAPILTQKQARWLKAAVRRYLKRF